MDPRTQGLPHPRSTSACGPDSPPATPHSGVGCTLQLAHHLCRPEPNSAGTQTGQHVIQQRLVVRMTRNRVVLPPRTCQSKSLTGCAHCLTHSSTIKPHAVFHQTLQPTCHDATPEEAVTSASGAGADGALGAEGSPVRTGADTADTGLVPTAVTTDARKKYVVDAVRPMTRITSPADVDDTCKLCKRHGAPRQQRCVQRWTEVGI